MLDFQIELLRQARSKGELSAAMQQEFLVRFGREAYNALPDSPEPEDFVIPALSAAADEEARLLYDRKSAARQLSISLRSLDALIANKRLDTRRIGSRVLIPRAVLVKFARADHPEPIQNATDLIQ